MLAAWKNIYDLTRQHIQKQRHYGANKGPYSQSYGFPSSHVWMWELDYKENWELKNMLLNCGVGEDFWESLGLQGDPTSPFKGNQSWIFIGRTDAEAEAPIIWSPDVNSQLTGKEPAAEKGWMQEEKGRQGWDDWMASLTQWTWIWANSRRQWRTGKPGVLQPMGS